MAVVGGHHRADDAAAVVGDEEEVCRHRGMPLDVLARIVPRAGDARFVPQTDDVVDVVGDGGADDGGHLLTLPSGSRRRRRETPTGHPRTGGTTTPGDAHIGA